MRTRTNIGSAWRPGARLAVGLLACCCLAQAQVSKWVDEKGVVHYGESVPEKFKSSAKVVPLRSDAPNAADARQAQSRLEGYRATLKPGNKTAETTASSQIAASTPDRPHEPSCDERWQQYRESLECFGPYRTANGAIKAEAFDHCPDIKEPTLCVGH
jgi:hypothetical protein